MRAPLVAMLSIAAGAVCAQSANEGIKDLESCFQLARAADVICSNPANGAGERLDCLQKARTAQLECLERVPPGASARSTPPESPTGTVSPNSPRGTVPLETPAEIAPPDKPTAAVSPDKPVAAVAPDLPAKAADIPSKPQDTNWVVSETTSPVDYSPLTTALIRIPSNVKDAPNTLAIRCRGPRTELLVRTEGKWQASRTSEVEVDYQINDQPVVRLQWTASADGKTASYKDDVVGLLRSLPESAQLRINVRDRPGPGQEAMFRLAGLDAVRKKIGSVCNWAPITDKVSSGKR